MKNQQNKIYVINAHMITIIYHFTVPEQNKPENTCTFSA